MLRRKEESQHPRGAVGPVRCVVPPVGNGDGDEVDSGGEADRRGHSIHLVDDVVEAAGVLIEAFELSSSTHPDEGIHHRVVPIIGWREGGDFPEGRIIGESREGSDIAAEREASNRRVRGIAQGSIAAIDLWLERVAYGSDVRKAPTLPVTSAALPRGVFVETIAAMDRDDDQRLDLAATNEVLADAIEMHSFAPVENVLAVLHVEDGVASIAGRVSRWQIDPTLAPIAEARNAEWLDGTRQESPGVPARAGGFRTAPGEAHEQAHEYEHSSHAELPHG